VDIKMMPVYDRLIHGTTKSSLADARVGNNSCALPAVVSLLRVTRSVASSTNCTSFLHHATNHTMKCRPTYLIWKRWKRDKLRYLVDTFRIILTDYVSLEQLTELT